MEQKGFVYSKHIFGTSTVGRNVNSYYLQWQWRHATNCIRLINLTRNQYTTIKGKLSHDMDVQTHLIGRSNAITYVHHTSSKYYMRVLRYLKKEKLL